MLNLEKEIQELMTKNRRQQNGHTYTVPSPDIYPFQWLWDSCFHSIILSYFDLEAAKAELRSALSTPLPSGLLPHIIYWKEVHNLPNWGREFRGPSIIDAFGTTSTSSLTQPPVQAMTLWRLYELDKDQTFLKELYPILKNHFQYLATERTFSNNSLIHLINPDESGEDNSPRFDRAQGLTHKHTAVENLEKRMLRMRQNHECNFEAKACMSNHFAVADGSFNILYLLDLGYMQKIAAVLNEKVDQEWFLNQAEAVRGDISQILLEDGLLRSYDQISQQPITSLTWTIFMPLLTDLLDKKHAERLVEDYFLHPEHFYTPYMIPTTAVSESSYDPDNGFWRGPVWIGANWFIYHGLKNYGFDDLAFKLRDNSLKLLDKGGFYEQFHPETGAGEGARNFTWGGLVLDMN